MLLKILTLFGALALFVFGMEMFSSAIQKFFGNKLRRFEKWMSSASPLKQILSGAGITATIQSSSATSILVVSLASAGALTLRQGICVIMGANIGTTVTPWIIGALGFNLNITALAFILLGVGFVMTFFRKSATKSLGQAILGLSLVFVGMIYMNSSLPEMSSAPEAAEFVTGITSHGAASVALCLMAGVLVAFILQSSIVSVVMTMVLVHLGWISFPMGAAMVLGSNIGTTIYANVAARKANVQARRTALAHTIFNVAGAVIVLLVFGLFLKANLWLTSLSGLDSRMAEVFGIACVHTMFNILASVVIVWFRKPFASLLETCIKDPEAKRNDFNLKFIGTNRMLGTPAISIEQAYKEAVHFASITQECFQYIEPAIMEKDPDRFEEYRQRLAKCEQVTDRFEYEIADFLNKVSMESVSEKEAAEIKIIYRIIGELESLGDSCENISRQMNRLHIHQMSFDEELTTKLSLLVSKVDQAFTVMVSNMKLASEGSLTDISNAYNAEDIINTTRDSLRSEAIAQIEKESKNFLTLNYFLDILAELEAMGDFIINVSQSMAHEFDK